MPHIHSLTAKTTTATARGQATRKTSGCDSQPMAWEAGTRISGVSATAPPTGAMEAMVRAHPRTVAANGFNA